MRRTAQKLTFGKYEGWDIRDVPEEYLAWLQQSSQRTLDMCTAEIERRNSEEEVSMSMMERIIRSGYRDLAKRLHPDVGGSDDAMKELNASYDALNDALNGRQRKKA